MLFGLPLLHFKKKINFWDLRIDARVSKSESIKIEKFIFSAQPHYFPNIRQLFPKLQCYLFSVLLGANLFKDLRQDVTHFGLDHLVILFKLKIKLKKPLQFFFRNKMNVSVQTQQNIPI